jgi:CRP/FNR family cyclic AMP-dependent transcriptional regulator
VESPLLAVLSEPDRRDFLALARRRRFTAGEVIFHNGDPGDTMHLMTKGHVAVRITTPLGDVATLRVIRSGEFFGELAVIAPGPRNATVVALDSVETLGIHKEQLDELRARRPAVEAVITNALVAEVRRLAAALTEALYLPSEPRLIRRLLEVASLFGTRGEPAAVVPLSQEALAQLAGLTRPTANRILRRAEEQGLVRIGRSKVEILDHQTLSRRAK